MLGIKNLDPGLVEDDAEESQHQSVYLLASPLALISTDYIPHFC